MNNDFFTGDIQLVTQGHNQCGLAVSAMASGESLPKVIRKAKEIGVWFDDKPGINDKELDQLLCALGLSITRQKYPTLIDNRVYIAVVPSLNRKACLHYVLFDTRHEQNPEKPEETVLSVYDPQQGNDKQEYYTAYTIKGWSALVSIDDWIPETDINTKTAV